jgi:nicotinamide mononucleotide (NMN) deamidase PncC
MLLYANETKIELFDFKVMAKDFDETSAQSEIVFREMATAAAANAEGII